LVTTAAIHAAQAADGLGRGHDDWVDEDDINEEEAQDDPERSLANVQPSPLQDVNIIANPRSCDPQPSMGTSLLQITI